MVLERIPSLGLCLVKAVLNVETGRNTKYVNSGALNYR